MKSTKHTAAKPALHCSSCVFARPLIAVHSRHSRGVACSSASFRASGHAPMPAQALDLPADQQPRLMNRNIDVNLLGTIARPAKQLFDYVDLAMACTVDRTAWLSTAAVVAVGVTAATGLGLFQQLFGTPPLWLMNAMEDRMGPTPLLLLGRLLALLASAPIALWHLRTWWAASTEACRHLWPSSDSAPQQGPASISAACSAAVCARFLTMLAAVSCAASSGLSSPLGVLLPALVSLAPLAAAVAPASKPADPSSPPQQQSGGLAAPALASSATAAAPLLLPVLASDFAALAAAALWSTAAPLAAVAAIPGVVLAAALFAAAQQPQYKQRWASQRAAAQDAAQVHITVYTDFGSKLDSSVGRRPLQVTVGKAIDDLATQRLGSELAAQVHAVSAADASTSGSGSSAAGSTQQSRQQAGAATGPSQAATGSMQDDEEATGPSSSLLDPLSPEVAQGTLRFCTPVMGAMLDCVLPGMLVGESTRVQVHNPLPTDGGFINPDLIWWQPLADVVEKFKAGGMPAPGQVFWFPLGPGPKDNMVPVRVNSVNEEFVELDGNDHIEDGAMVVEVKLVALQKP